MNIIQTKGAPAAIGPYSQGISTENRVSTPKPARSCVAVKDLPKGALCEIEAVAELD